MGWTYSAYLVERGSVDFESHKDECMLDPLLDDIWENGTCIIDDSVFDRESLGRWMGLTADQRNGIQDNGYCIVTLDQFKTALNFLNDLVAKVKKMPFDSGGTNQRIYVGWDKEKNEGIYKWTGTKKNKEIYDLVMESFSRDYHFNFPWDYKGKDVGVPEYIDVLKSAIYEIENIITNPMNKDNEFDIILMSY